MLSRQLSEGEMRFLDLQGCTDKDAWRFIHEITALLEVADSIVSFEIKSHNNHSC